MEDAEISEVAKLMWEAPYAVLSHDMEEEPSKYAQLSWRATVVCSLYPMTGVPSHP